MRTRTARALWIGVVVALLGNLGATAPPAQAAPTAPDTGCTAGHPNRLQLRSDDADEWQYLDDTKVCANPDLTEATLANDTGVVWTFDGGGEGFVELESARLGAVIFREGLSAQGGNPRQFVAPGETMRLTSSTPGGITGIRWEIEPRLTAVWMAQEAILGQAQKLVKGGIVSVLTRKKTARGAIFTCAFVGVTAARSVVALAKNSDDFFDAFEAASELSPCVTAWGAAKTELGTRFPTLDAAVVGVVDSSAQVAKVRTGMSWASRLISVALRLSPR